ncbi:MAG TPA: xanthine dehydrogenase family protein molybdopterin-binding subunit [Chloroflexota bacterium]|nr:xanthine dehydrogenase family protein molybdopterin-binding subunit [Chloroflexota bacterium]
MATVIGERVPRVEGVEKVTGRALYSANALIPGTIWGKCARSPYAYARIKSIDVSKAKALPGVLAVITAKDIKNNLVGKRVKDQPILAEDVVRFIGERVAAVAAEDKDVAEQAVDLIEVEYEELDPLLDPLTAMSDAAPLLHPNYESYVGKSPAVPAGMKNVHAYGKWEKGDVAAGFAEADEIVEGRYTTARMHQAYIEPHASVVSIDNEGRVHVWSAQKQPYGLRDALAQALEMPIENVVYEYTRVGGEFGGKGHIMDVPLCYYLAKATGRPVRMIMTYTEEFMAANPRHPGFIEFKTGVKKDGTIVAHQSRVLFDGGAYGGYKPVPTVDLGGARKAGGAYRIPNTSMESVIVYTNHVPGGFMRAPGDPQVLFALESHIDEIAYKLGLDPLEFRRHNILRPGDANAAGEKWEDLRAVEVLEAAVAKSNYGKAKPKPNIGRGMAITNRHIGGGDAEALIQIDSQGQVTLVTGTADAGQGSHTVQQQILAELLSIPLSQIRVTPGNTDVAPFDPGVGGGRTTHVTGQAVVQAAGKAVDELKGWAAEMRGWPENEVTLEDGHFVAKGEQGEAVSFAEAAREAIRRKGEPLEFRSAYSKNKVEQECFCAQVAEVEVDPDTGQVTVLSITTAHDSGTLINPMAAEGQVEGGVIQGFGFGVMEEMMVEDGKVANPNMGEYKIPTIADVPDIREAWVEDAPGPLPFNGRALSEHSLIVTAGAINNAVRDACGVRITSTPITAEKVYKALHGA